MWQHPTLAICVANKKLKLLLDSSGKFAQHTFTYIPLRLDQQVCWAPCFSVSQQNANAGKLMYFKTQVARNRQRQSLQTYSSIWKQLAASRLTGTPFPNPLKCGSFSLCKQCRMNQSGESNTLSNSHAFLLPSWRRQQSSFGALALTLLYTPFCPLYAKVSLSYISPHSLS